MNNGCKCNGCGWVGWESQVAGRLTDEAQLRLKPGQIVPLGICPVCNGFAVPYGSGCMTCMKPTGEKLSLFGKAWCLQCLTKKPSLPLEYSGLRPDTGDFEEAAMEIVMFLERNGASRSLDQDPVFKPFLHHVRSRRLSIALGAVRWAIAWTDESPHRPWCITFKGESRCSCGRDSGLKLLRSTL